MLAHPARRRLGFCQVCLAMNDIVSLHQLRHVQPQARASVPTTTSAATIQKHRAQNTTSTFTTEANGDKTSRHALKKHRHLTTQLCGHQAQKLSAEAITMMMVTTKVAAKKLQNCLLANGQSNKTERNTSQEVFKHRILAKGTV